MPPRRFPAPETTSAVMGDLQDPYGAAAGFSPAAAAAGAGEAEEEDMRGGEARARRKRGMAPRRRSPGAEAEQVAGKRKMEARSVEIGRAHV